MEKNSIAVGSSNLANDRELFCLAHVGLLLQLRDCPLQGATGRNPVGQGSQRQGGPRVLVAL